MPETTTEGEGAAQATPEAPVQGITAVLQALADPIRLAMVRSLAAADTLTCGGFNLPITKSTASHHFHVLRDAGIISARYEGTRKLLTLRRADLDAAYPGLLDSVLRSPAGDLAQP